MSKKYKITHQQNRVWIEYRMDPSSSANNTNIQFKLVGNLDIKKLKKSCKLAIKYMDSFRSYFEEKDGEVYQIILPKSDLDLEIIDLSNKNYSLEKIENEAQKILNNILSSPINLEKHPISQFYLIKISEDIHYFFLDTSHIISDGYSVFLLIKFLSLAYEKGENGIKEFFGDSIKGDEDYFKYLEENYDEKKRDDGVNYWVKQLTDTECEMDFYLKYNKDIKNEKTKSINFSISQELSEKLKEVVKKIPTTPFNFLSAVFSVVLYRYFKQEHFNLGYPISIRPPEFKHAWGFYVNTLPLKIDVSNNPTFQELVERVNTNRKSDRLYQNVSALEILPQLRKELYFKGRLFNITFSQASFFPPSLELEGIQSLPTGVGYAMSQDDLSLIFDNGRENVDFAFEYKPSILSDNIADNFTKNFKYLLEKICQDPTQKICDIDIVNDDEKRELIEVAERNNFYQEKFSSIIDLFEDQVDAAPDSIATAYEDSYLTYAQLNEKVNQLAHYLIESKIDKCNFISICLERSHNLIIAILAVLKAGRCFVTLDPEYSKNKISYILKDSASQFVILDNSAIKKSGIDADVNYINLDKLKKTLTTYETDNLNLKISPNDPAYIIYTSGSTGEPKGVIISHNNLSIRIQWRIKYFNLGSNDTLLHKNNYSFDPALGEVFWSLTVGAKLIIVPNHDSKDQELLLQLVRKYNINFIDFVPSALRFFLEYLKPNQNNSIKLVFCGGEALTPSLVKSFYEKLPKAKLYNLYGPTETTIDATFFESEPQIDYKMIPIGEPLANSSCYILDEKLNLLPRGVIGELFIGGQGVSLGYLNRQELTKESFVKNPFTNKDNDILYRTKDSVRYLDNGDIEFIGRDDGQVKIRGFRIETGEVEEVISTYSNINCQGVVCDENKRGNKRLVAFIELKDKTDFDLDNFRDYLEAKLPNYMVPASIIVLDNLPILVGGKVDKKKLMSLSKLDGFKHNDIFLHPRDSLEKIIQKIWKDILDIDEIGIDDDFFHLGGDSLLSIKVALKLENSLKIKVNTMTVYNNPTIRKIANYLRNNNSIDESENIDLDAEAVLDEDIKIIRPKFTALKNAKDIFLTAPLNFVGIFLLKRLLDESDATIYCFVRDQDEESGFNKIKSALENYHLWNSSYLFRIKVVLGNLSKPNLGIGDEDLEILIENVDVIYHNAAIVDFNYSNIRQTNVLATKDLIRLASLGKSKTLHYISNMAVFQSLGYLNYSFIDEDTMLSYSSGLCNGYAKSRWVSEKLVQQAINRGLPGRIYRPSNIIDDLDSKIKDDDELLNRLLKAIAYSGYFPTLDYKYNIISMSCCLDHIVKISNVEKPPRNIFHIFSSNYISLKDMAKCLTKLGYNIDECSYAEWLDKISILEGNEEVLGSLINLFTDAIEYNVENFTLPQMLAKDNYPKYLSKKTNNFIKLPVNQISKKNISEYITDLVNSGYIKREIPKSKKLNLSEIIRKSGQTLNNAT